MHKNPIKNYIPYKILLSLKEQMIFLHYKKIVNLYCYPLIFEEKEIKASYKEYVRDFNAK